ncbi:hypothetical protein D3C84_1036880 [compost metagenome]
MEHTVVMKQFMKLRTFQILKLRLMVFIQMAQIMDQPILWLSILMARKHVMEILRIRVL